LDYAYHASYNVFFRNVLEKCNNCLNTNISFLLRDI
jgi:hypothetical protein